MDLNIKLPNSETFLVNLVLQRTSPLLLLGYDEALIRWFNSGDTDDIKKLINNKNFLKNYLNILLKEINNEVDELIKVFKNTEAKNLVSIGPGNGFIELILTKRLDLDKVLLIDIENSKIHRHGFFNEGSGYAKLNETKSFFVNNGINENSIICCNPNKEKIPNFRTDILISILSMGFHYPCNDYVNFILENTKKGSIICIDKRKEVNDRGFEKLSKYFKISDSKNLSKHIRLLLSKI